MSPLDGPKGDTRRAQHEGTPVSAYQLTPSRVVAVLASGALFGFGLALSTMVQPEVVLSFLRFQDFGLMLVLGGAVAVTLLAYSVLPRLRKSPLLGGSFERHTAALNAPTLIGSAMFGMGWGLSGVCPGPAIAGLGTGNWQLLWALLGIVVGAGLQGWSAQARRPPTR
jgi:uncharacterized membrane protein YedE/YeeE